MSDDIPLTLTDQDFARRAEDLEWILLDVDGVFTDGTLYYSAEGEALKPFHVRDGLAVEQVQVGLPGEPDPAEARWVAARRC